MSTEHVHDSVACKGCNSIFLAGIEHASDVLDAETRPLRDALTLVVLRWNRLGAPAAEATQQARREAFQAAMLALERALP